MSLVCIVIIILVAIVSGYLIYAERVKDKYCNCSGMDSIPNSYLYRLWQSAPLQQEQVMSNGQMVSYPSRLVSLASIPGARLPPGAVGATMNSGLATTVNYQDPDNYSSIRSYDNRNTNDDFRVGVL